MFRPNRLKKRNEGEKAEPRPRNYPGCHGSPRPGGSSSYLGDVQGADMDQEQGLELSNSGMAGKHGCKL